ncbi:queuosine precursor transporter [Lacibacter sediminis]|uniref:Probable queuosine precursor transporter n=1 Tax=Lacibacter sediminis TaxID=2760713 RepID=A0A7G5XLC6_9BACT|nr:queuosine precursor transporter [Lacibacter sediminis]QNA46279.1 queuosine precursor transporter [Lacibacter sediminis]
MIKQILSDKSTKLFLILSGFFIANAMIAEFIGVKIFSLEDTIGIKRLELPLFGSNFSFHLTAGVLLWPVVFIMTDIINEYYGSKGVKFLSYLTVTLIAYSFLMFSGAIGLKPSEYFTIGNDIDNANNAFKGIFGQGLWIIIGSMVAFLIGQVLDVLVFHRIKKATGEKRIWLRATGSTLISQLVDSFVVLFIAFYIGRRIQEGQGDAWSLKQILVTGTGNYIYKFIVAIALTPVIYLIHGVIERYLGHDKAAEMKKAAMLD